MTKYLIATILSLFSIYSHASSLCIGSCGDTISIQPPVESVLQPIFPIKFPPVGRLQILPKMTDGVYRYGDSFWATTIISHISSFSLPYFSDSRLTNLKYAADWSLLTDSTNPFNLDGAGLMTFTYNGSSLDSGGNLFFDSIYEPTEVGVIFKLTDGSTYKSNILIPLSPDAIKAGLMPYSLPVPESDSSGMLLFGLAVFGLRLRRKLA